MDLIGKKEVMELIGSLSENECENVWRRVCSKDLVNWQKAVAWMAVHECLPTREFQRRRRMVDSEVCPREGCGQCENVYHLFWGCKFAKEVWKNMGKLIEGLTGIKRITYEMVYVNWGRKK